MNEFKIDPQNKYRLIITPEFHVHTEEMPSAWIRFWAKVFLGWHWEKL